MEMIPVLAEEKVMPLGQPRVKEGAEICASLPHMQVSGLQLWRRNIEKIVTEKIIQKEEKI
jgi:hypothetical protein